MNGKSFMRGLFLASLGMWMLLASGCALLRARQDLAQLEEIGTISGRVTGTRMPGKPVCVALFEDVPGRTHKKLVAYKVIFDQQTFSFSRLPATYHLFAFEDANEDGAFQTDEKVGWHGQPTPRNFAHLAAVGRLPVPLLVSISTPWQGHPGASLGVERSPVILPCWYDMSPGSHFLEAIRQRPFPAGTDYYLLAGYRGGKAMLTAGNTDGTLPLASMLDLGMQDSAVKVLVFDERHSGILDSPEVAARLNRILEQVAR